MVFWSWYADRNLAKSKNWLKLTDLKLFKSIETHFLGWHIHETSTHRSEIQKFAIKSFCYLNLRERSCKVSFIFLIFTMF